MDNVVADALSRLLPSPSRPPQQQPASVFVVGTPGVDLAALASRQAGCADVAAMRRSSSLDVVFRRFGDVTLLGDVSFKVFRPLVPVDFRRSIFDTLHGVAHPGSRASKRLISSRFVWTGMATDITRWARQCVACQTSKVGRHIQLAPALIPVPAQRFSHIHIDLVGPLPASGDFTHIFTVVDRSTRWPVAVPMSSTSTAACAAALFSGWVAAHGVPAVITSDRGPQFTSSVWAALCDLLGIAHAQTTAYHPQSNGLVERFHRRLKEALRARAASSGWHLHLPWVLLGLRANVKSDGSVSPAELVYGAQLVLPGEMVDSADPLPAEKFLTALRAAVDGFRPLPVVHNKSSGDPVPARLPDSLLGARFVFIRRDAAHPSLEPSYTGPFEVLERSLRTFRVLVGQRPEIISCSRLKAAELPPDTLPAQPPRRGRPRAVSPPSVRVPVPAPATPSTAPWRRPGRRSTRVTFAPGHLVIPDTPVGRPERLRRPPERLGI